MEDKTEQQQAIHTLHMLVHSLKRWQTQEAALKVAFPETSIPATTTAWLAYCATRNKVWECQDRIYNLTKLLSGVTDPQSHNTVGFDAHGRLVIGGDWVEDTDNKGDYYCLDCARTLLLSGDWDPQSVRTFKSSNYRDSTVYCQSCKALIQ